MHPLATSERRLLCVCAPLGPAKSVAHICPPRVDRLDKRTQSASSAGKDKCDVPIDFSCVSLMAFSFPLVSLAATLTDIRCLGAEGVFKGLRGGHGESLT